MSAHPWADRLSEYLDGDLAADERALMDRHLAGCPACRAELRELEHVRNWLRADPAAPADQPSHAELAAIQGRIAGEVIPLRPRPDRRRWLAAGGVAAAAAVLAAVMLARTGPSGGPDDVLPPVRVAAAPAPYGRAWAELEAELRRGGRRLDPESAHALARTLAGIDRAIAEAEAARAADPGNDYVARHLDRLRGERTATLRDAVAAARS